MKINGSVLVLVILTACTGSSIQRRSFSGFNQSLCHVSKPGYKGMIIHGRVPHREKWPWIVALVEKTDNKYFAGGSLISERFVLTAAHCIQNKGEEEPRKPEDVKIYLGKWNLSDAIESNAVQATPQQFIIHADWNVRHTRWDADIAIVKLVDEVKLSSNIQPVCLWTSQMQPDEAHDGGMVVGWGKTENQKVGEHSDIPMEVETKVLPIFDCYHTDGLRDAISPRGLCVGGTGSGPCNGDSGGGLFTFRGDKWFLRGITSVSRMVTATNDTHQCDVNQPTVFTNVEKFTSWIKSILGQIDCEFSYEANWNGYLCNLKTASIRHDTKTSQIRGSHVGNRTNADVINFNSLRKAELKILPVKLGEFFPNLERYEVRHSGVDQLQRHNFEDLPKLRILAITNSQLREIPIKTFNDLANLESLVLEDNQIGAIDSSLFIYNTKLRFIDLSNNEIQNLQASLFKKNLELAEIDFGSNLIVSVEPELLTSLENMIYVNFSNNTCIDEAWKNVSPTTGEVSILTSFNKTTIQEAFESKCAKN